MALALVQPFVAAAELHRVQRRRACLDPAAVDAYRRAAAIRKIWSYREPRLNRWMRRLWPNPMLPAAFDALRAKPPCHDVLRLLDEGFVCAAKQGVRELMELEESDAARRDPVA